MLTDALAVISLIGLIVNTMIMSIVNVLILY